MKILYLVTKSNWGGAQKYVFDLAKNIKNENLEVVVAFGGSGILKKKLEEENIRTLSIKGMERDVDLEKEIEAIKSLWKILKKEKPDIVHLNSSKMGVVGAFLGRILDIKKIIFTAHGFPFREDRSWWQKIILRFLSWLTVLLSHKTICVSKKDFEDVKDWPLIKNKLLVIHNGININDFQDAERKESSVNTRIVSIGELHKNKGFEYAIKAMNRLRSKFPNFSYDIFSFGGDEEKNLKYLIKNLQLEDFVRLNVNKENHIEKLKEADIYLLSSIKEGLPYVLLEAGIYALPVVASDTGGVSEIIKDKETGILIEPKNTREIAVEIERIMRDKDLARNLGENLKEKIKNGFSLDRMVEDTKELYF